MALFFSVFKSIEAYCKHGLLGHRAFARIYFAIEGFPLADRLNR